jgi:hypothetical protein
MMMIANAAAALLASTFALCVLALVYDCISEVVERRN